MFVISLIIFTITLHGAFAGSALDIICKSKISVLNETNRNILTLNHKYECDSAVAKRYYTFGVDKKLPGECPKVGSCSSDLPLWTEDKQPDRYSPGPVTLTLCGSYSQTGNDLTSLCKLDCQTKIQAVYCSNLNMVVYEFNPVRFCNMRYCYKQSIPCGPTQSSVTGYEPCVANFAFHVLPNAILTYSSADTDPLLKNQPGEVLLKTVIKCPVGVACNQLTGDVLWYTNSSVDLIKRTELKHDPTKNELYSFLGEAAWTPQINSIFYSEVIPKNQGFQPPKPFTSNHFYAGLMMRVTNIEGKIQTYRYSDIYDIPIEIQEGNKKFAQLDIYTTIPILCKFNNMPCTLDIQMAKETKYGTQDIARIASCSPDCKGCMRNLGNQTVPDPKKFVNWQIYPTIDSKNLHAAASMKFSLFIKDSLFLAADFWKKLPLPLITIQYIPKDLPITAVGSSLNDPHLLTHDKTRLEFHGRDGEYVVLENHKSLLYVHTITDFCSKTHPGVYSTLTLYCNLELYIQSVDDVIFHNIKEPDNLYYSDLNVTSRPIVVLGFNGENGVISKTTSLKVKKTATTFKIITHFGTIIVIDKLSGNFYIYPSKFDLNNVNGILGDYNNDASDDLTINNVVLTQDKFFDLYRVTTTGRPRMSLRSYYVPTQQQIDEAGALIPYCTCTKPFNNDTVIVTCPLGLSSNEGGHTATYDKTFLTTRVQQQLTNKMMRFDRTKIALKNNNEETGQKRNKRQAVNTCSTKLRTPELLNCSKLGLVDIDILINNCNLDFTWTNQDIWAPGYARYAEDVCRTKLLNDYHNFQQTARGQLAPRADILMQLCPNKCNNNGVCNEEAKCICNAPFDGYDCSIDTSIPIHIYDTSSQSNICDVNVVDSTCYDLMLLVDRTSSKMVMSYDILIKKNDGTMSQIESGTYSDILTFNDNVIYGKLNKPTSVSNMPVYYYKVRITDGSESNTIMYAIIESNCYECVDANNCGLMSGKCDIGGRCYNDGDRYPLNPTKHCDSMKNMHDWTQK